MTGNLQIKNGKYYIVLNCYVNGKRRLKWIATGLPEKGNKRRAEQLLRERIAEEEKQTPVMQTDMTVSDCVRYWLTQVQRKVDAVTYQGYLVNANTHVLPYFDANGLLLRRMTLQQLQSYFDEKSVHGRCDGKGGLSAASLRQLKNILNQAMNIAVKGGYLSSNPCQFVELPANKRFEPSFYSVGQMQTLLEAIKDDTLYPLVKVDAFYGLRRSELLGLKWDSIDFSTGLVTIRHTVSKVTHVVEKDTTKNATSRRSFPLTEDIRELFLSLKHQQEENRKLFGKEYIDTEYVFCWPDGHPISPDYVSHRFADLLLKYNLPHIRFHELRHSCASLLLNQGFTLKDVQEWLGHSDIKMTANIYGHLDVARKQGMAEKMSFCIGERC